MPTQYTGKSANKKTYLKRKLCVDKKRICNNCLPNVLICTEISYLPNAKRYQGRTKNCPGIALQYIIELRACI